MNDKELEMYLKRHVNYIKDNSIIEQNVNKFFVNICYIELKFVCNCGKISHIKLYIESAVNCRNLRHFYYITALVCS